VVDISFACIFSLLIVMSLVSKCSDLFKYRFHALASAIFMQGNYRQTIEVTHGIIYL
jgi:hypothetical protein